MAYKEKTCPKCGVVHKKRGEFCSRSCGNARVHSAETKAKLSKKQTEWLTSGTDEAEVAKHNFISKRDNAIEEPVPPQIHSPLKTNQFIDGGDLWEEV